MGTEKKRSLRIVSIQCHGTNDTGGLNDEVFIEHQADAGPQFRFPATGTVNMNTEVSSDAVQTWDVGLVVDYNFEVLVTLWDDDVGGQSRSDFLINRDYTPDDMPTSYRMKNENGADYSIYVEPVADEGLVLRGDLVRFAPDGAFAALERHLEHRRKHRPAETARPAGGRSVPPPPEPVREILAEASRAAEGWRRSTAASERLRDADPETVRRLLDELLAGPRFARTRELIAAHNASEADVGFPIEAVSIGLYGQVDLGLGLYGSTGYVADLDDPSTTQAGYVLGGLEEGAIEGADVGVEIGLWRDSTDDLDGYYNAQNVDVDDGVGGALFALEHHEEVAAYLVDVGVGEDDGVAENELLMLTFDPAWAPVEEADAKHFLILTRIECLETSERGHDEVYFEFTPDGGTTYRYPPGKYYSMSDDPDDEDEDKVWLCGRSVKLDSYVDVDVRDDDTTGSTLLASFRFNIADFEGPGATSVKTASDAGKYKLTAKLVY